MKVKKYVVRDLKEAMRMIKEELGDDAVILSTRRVKKGGFLGIGAKTYFEVTAVVEERKKVQDDKKKREDIYRLQEILMLNRNRQVEKSTGVEREIERIKEMIGEIKSMIVSGRNMDLPPGISSVERALRKHEVDGEVISKIIEYLRITFGDVDVNDETFKGKFKEYLVPFIKAEEVDIKGKVIFVGPTGVGKTTTLAKLAARLKIELGKDVSILTLDTYRIAAADQLKTYASIMDIPIRVAYTPQEAKLELEAMSDREIILMDTAGRSQKNDIQMGELKAVVDSIEPDITFLVISMNYRYSDVKEIIRRFKVVNPTHVILTKMDETGSYGHFVNIPYSFDLPIAYVTNGQRVPEDIFPANPVELADILSKGVLEDAGSG